MIRPFWVAALMLVGCTTPSAPAKTRDELQLKLDGVNTRCGLNPNMKLRALSESEVLIDFAKPPEPEVGDKRMECLLAEIKKLPGVTLGFLGNEQYLDEEGNRR